MQAVEIVDTQDSGYFVSEYTNGSTYGYTLRRGDEYVNCDEVMIMEGDDESLEFAFEEWKHYALSGEAGYTYWTEWELVA